MSCRVVNLVSAVQVSHVMLSVVRDFVS